ncbi:MAG TPA: SDR family NAD(P)-dependent oxidoreductase, partial [Labilithrix sp.]|nr:SDR family NAD(P)-dependent oxidoreductase [Labilithrix sp.]
MDLREPLIEATKKLKVLRAEIDQLQYRSREPIAIVSVDCRLPGGVDDPESYWRMLDEGRDAIEPFPADRWPSHALYDPDPETKGKTYSTRGGFLRGIDRFDAGFFGITPREAAGMDPAQRLVLECVWNALERAGIRPADLRQSNTGVYFGAVGSDYEPWGGRSGMDGMDGYAFTGRDGSVLSGRVSYTLGLQGPAITVNTACSSSLVALHLACQALRAGECDLALCGGAQVMTTPASFVEFSRLRGIAPDGRCKSYSDDANGTGWSEGCGVLVLQRLSDALRDGRRILALVRGSAVNQDGRSQGLTAPNGPAQERVIRRALEESGLTSADIDAVEGHGTGTSLGDPIEVSALSAVFGPGRPNDRPLYLGSAKSNIGHTQAAAGVAGVIKMALALEQEKLPRSLHAEKPNRRVAWDGTGVVLLDQAREWTRGSRVRRAGVSSFGVGGTNAHVILEEAPAIATPHVATAVETAVAPPMLPLLVSAIDAGALDEQVVRLADWVEGQPNLSALDLAFSLATARTHFPARLAMGIPIDRSPVAVAESLRAFHRGRASAETHATVQADRRAGKLVMLFSGQGSQRPGMGKELYSRYPAFRDALDAVLAELDPKLPRPLLEVMFASPDTEATALLDQTQYTQPALFALSVALFRQWEKWGLVPDLLLGHSVGELAAAHIAGVFSLADACTLVAARGRLMQQAPSGGAMFSVGASDAEVAELLAGLEDRLSIAAINEPAQTVIAGDLATAEAVVARLEALGKKVRRLRVSHAFHSPHMNGILDEYRRIAENIEYRKPRITLLSNLTGKPCSAEQVCSADYWVRQVRGAVRFRDAVIFAEAAGADCYLECGPQGTLSAMAASSVKGTASTFIPSLVVRDGSGEAESLVDALTTAHVAARSVDWDGVFDGLGARRIDVPTYRFQRQRYWLSGAGRSETEAEGVGLRRVGHAVLGAETSLPEGGHLFTARLGPSTIPFLQDHRVFDQVVLPGMSIVEVMATAARRVGASRLGNVTLEAPLIFSPPSHAMDLQVRVDAALDEAKHQRAFRVHARPLDATGDGSWSLHASGVLELGESHEERATLNDWPPPDTTPVDLGGLYDRLRARGLGYGPAFRCLREVHRRGGELYARVVLPAEQPSEGFAIHPALLDAGLHAILANEEDGPAIRVPFEMEDAWVGPVSDTPPRELRVHIVPRGFDESGAIAAASVAFYDTTGAVVAVMERCAFRSITSEKWRGARTSISREAAEGERRGAALYRVAWTSQPPPRGPDQAPQGAHAVVGSSPIAHAVVTALRAAGVEVVRLDTVAELRARRTELDVTTVVRVVDVPSNDDHAAEARRATVAMVEEQQAWLAEPAFATCRYVLVTEGAVATTQSDRESVCLAHAPLWGLVRSMMRENPERRWMILDTDRTEASQGALAAVLLAEDEAEVALRAGRRVVPRLARAHAPARGGIPSLHPKGTVLVTGGTSGLGAVVAEHLARQHGARHLLLTSRQGPTATGALELTKRLTELGCSVTVAACDVSDRTALEKLIAGIPPVHPLTAVFHCAAVLDDGPVASLTADKVARVFAPKVDGAFHLHQLTRHRKLSAFVLSSSIAGIFGNEGQGGYAAANTFLDALCADRQRHGLPAQSLAWGPWADVGMMTRLSAHHQDRIREAGFVPMAPAIALEMFDSALEHAEPLVVPVSLDEQALRGDAAPSPLLRALLAKAAPPSVPSEPKVAEAPSLRRRLDQASPAERATMLLALVRTEVAVVLKLPDAGD